MGYVKDNFPGSPAAFQRARIAKGFVAYAFGFGTIIYFPFARAHRQAIKEGAWDNPEWFTKWISNISEKTMKGNPTREDLEQAMETSDKLNRGDVAGPDLLKLAKEQPSPSPPSA